MEYTRICCTEGVSSLSRKLAIVLYLFPDHLYCSLQHVKEYEFLHYLLSIYEKRLKGMTCLAVVRCHCLFLGEPNYLHGMCDTCFDLLQYKLPVCIVHASIN